MDPSFYKTAQAPCGYGTEWLVRLDNPNEFTTKQINAELVCEPGETLYLHLQSEDEARYWARRFLKLNANRFEEFPAYTLLVVSVNAAACLVTFKRSGCEQGHNSYLDPDTGAVRGYNPPRYEVMSF